ncbi:MULTISPECIES: fimbrial protein [Enterobacter]|jgi:P pilus assembly protein, pilin FimA|uniref:Type 1 fimbrial protein n=1 Tax=Enterobacter mori TaxID=539813 RepID=A0A9Q7K483_9ENTR|nr:MULTISPECIES: fimbrial protein [Enterobacter]EKX7628254.1 type 1 fimbrial protein [Enterobacter mori]EME8859639.1 type 1 fimbrial protein [Enterobacter mori]MBS0862565.1 type 1 fimbrial protein [Enterobacter mori]MBT1883612.1 type 1 fimbrial protein [Enterobacter mori]MBT2102554.1 type 1 fimbrial protein [Enterobacter mori]
MDLKNNIFAGIALAAVSMNSFAAEMNAGTIHFTGEIIEPSCTIEGDNGTDSTIPLGTYPKSVFTEVGKETTYMPFTITLANCPLKSDGLPAVQLTFNGPTTLTGTNTLLDVSKITTTGDTAATGIGVAVSPAGKDDQLITMDGAEGQVYIELATKSSDTIQADFNARYKSFAAEVTAGPADADMTVNILYR